MANLNLLEPGRGRQRKVGSLLLILICVASACGGGEDAPALNEPPVATTDLGAGLELTINSSWIVAGTFRDDPASTGAPCVYQRINVLSETDASIRVFRVGRECSAASVGRGNGEDPTFSSATQLAGATNATTEAVEVGTLTIANVEYFECTNECIDYDAIVGVVELSDPTNDAFPTIVISDDYERASRDQIRQLAMALSASSS